MELSSFAAKFKRIKDWQEFLDGVLSTEIKASTQSTLTKYKDVLSNCWKTGQISSDDEVRIGDLERQLEYLNDEARLQSSSHTSITKKAGRDKQQGHAHE